MDTRKSRVLGEAAGHGPIVPRAALVAAAVVIALTVAGAGLGRLAGAGAPTPETSPLLASRTLSFADRADGAVIITDAANGGAVEVLQGENGFVRGTMRALARERHQRSADLSTPFRLSAWQDGRVTLDDPATGRRIELTSFGTTNVGEFVKMLPPPPVRTATR